jgi:hypothetical protein
MGDFEQWIRLCSNGELFHIDEPLASWRQHDSNMSLNSFGAKNSIELEIIRKSAEATLDALSESLREELSKTFYATWNKLKAISEIRAPRSWRSLRFMLQSLHLILKHREVKLRRPWTPQEVIACLFPFMARRLITFSFSKKEALASKPLGISR